MAEEKYDYTVKVAGFFYGKHFKALDRIRLTPTQAKYEILGGNLYERGKEPWAADAAATLAAEAASVSSSGVIGTITGRSRKSRTVTEST